MPRNASAYKKTIRPEEVAKFDALASQWWDETGPLRPLHLMNPARLRFIREAVLAATGRPDSTVAALKGLRVLDVGCGGGILTEPLARMGGRVTGIDAAAAGIAVAKAHAAAAGMAIDYRVAAVEDLVARTERYDLICALEIIEHVADPAAFVSTLAQLLTPRGVLVIATINRNLAGFMLGIVAAEYVLGLLPRGTHDWRAFLKPSELAALAAPHGLRVARVAGMAWRPAGFTLTPVPRVNYLMALVRANVTT